MLRSAYIKLQYQDICIEKLDSDVCALKSVQSCLLGPDIPT